MKQNQPDRGVRTIEEFLANKSTHTRDLFYYFVQHYQLLCPVDIRPAKTMIGIATHRKRIAYITQLGKNFIHVYFPFPQPYPDNLCFQKIAQVPGDDKQFNHHLRLYDKEDLNEEVREFMSLAYQLGC
ncbi:DUF5655 domain-containing protein [Adhaeribacter radiodurans]|uniref:DUF5655 domain-containing protein n=1 Tax=Adhaeribacter radiodurans TaxID=2745197 RepID=A0A7L7L591_9BACT|nr:DUF5655 domain-containing protein [Adhaeribacter radiodurans]QMU27765.1 hypothetical protein HUW48_06770 [Adhaeribacter radiodurans]